MGQVVLSGRHFGGRATYTCPHGYHVVGLGKINKRSTPFGFDKSLLYFQPVVYAKQMDIGPDRNQHANKTVEILGTKSFFIVKRIQFFFLFFPLTVYCLTPPTIEHARHSALPEQATFDLDSTVQYHCHTGYVTAGFPRAKCLAIGMLEE